MLLQRYPALLGELGVLEFRELAFDVRRIYWLISTPVGVVRGLHAHKSLQQFIFCVNGNVDLLLDDGIARLTYSLSKEDDGQYVAAGQWRELSNFSEDAVVMVMASHEFDPDDYIHDYEEFIAWKASQ